ncbi:MAG TPA: type VI secretion system protein [Gemmatimonadaceae bacterium]|nr:type VI secretion system protein [Gemmatimonadaceae bacterium]
MRNVLPWILIGLSVAGGLALLVWSMLRPEEDEEIDDGQGVGPNALAITASESTKANLAQTTEEFGASKRKSRILSMKASLERSLDTTIGARASTKDRMTMPWFLLVGADGSGKATVLANNGLALPFGPPMEVDARRKDAGKWWLFDDAVVLEAPKAAPGTTASTATLAPEQTVADASVGWHTLIHMLRRERPDSPLNGIIVTISSADLLGGRANPEKLADQAERIRAFLERTRKLLGVRLPLHVLITKCDTLPGFRTFAQTLPEARRDDIFGWANPHDVHATFDAAWVDEAFESLRKQLAHLRDEMLAAADQVSDTAGIFVFDTEFAALHEPLKAFVAGLVTAGERRPSLFFRGAYFTGDAVDPVPEDQAVTVRASRSSRNRSSEFAMPSRSHRLVFLRALFEDKIFKEAGLARPIARFRLARDRRVVLAQAAAILLLLGGSFGLWRAVYGWHRDSAVEPGLRENAQMLTRVLSGLAIDLEAVKRRNATGEQAMAERRAHDAAVIELVGQMRDLPSTRVRSVFIPSSWFSSLPGDIRTSMMRGVQNIVLPVIRERLQERSVQLLGPAANSGNGAIGVDADPTLDPASLATYLSDVRTLSRNIERYNSLASPSSGSVAEMSALLDYLFSERVSNDTTALTRDFENALITASGPPIAVTPRMVSTVLNRAAAVVSSVASSAGRRLAPRGSSRSQTEADAQADLDALMNLASLIELVDPKRGLVATVSDSAILGVKLARLVQDSVEAQLRFAAARIRSDTLSPSDAADSLKRVVGELFRLRLMARAEGGEISGDLRANQRLRWDVGRLELALALRGEFVQAALGIVGAFPGQPPQRMAKALEGQLRARVLDVAASAQRFTAGGDENMLDVRTAAANLDAAGARIARLSALLDTLGATQEARRLNAAAARQAEHTLATAQALVDRQRYFAPQTAKIASWQGVIPISYAALGVVDSLSFFTTLINHTTDIRTLAHDIAPALKYLRSPAVDSVHERALLARWEGLVTSVGRYERGDYSSSLGTLWRFLREDMSMHDVSACAAGVSPDLGPVEADLFAMRRRQFQAAMLGRCRGGSADALAAYARMRALFSNKLAGRFPFVDSAQAPRAQEADPAALREFMRQYDAFLLASDVALRSDPRIAQSARGAIEFLDQLSAVRSFMAPFVEASDRGSAGFSLVIRASADDEREVAWRFGDSVHVSTAVDSLGNEEPIYFRGGWAPLRYVMQRRDSSATIRFFHPWSKVELAVPSLFPTAAPDIFIPRLR